MTNLLFIYCSNIIAGFAGNMWVLCNSFRLKLVLRGEDFTVVTDTKMASGIGGDAETVVGGSSPAFEPWRKHQLCPNIRNVVKSPDSDEKTMPAVTLANHRESIHGVC